MPPALLAPFDQRPIHSISEITRDLKGLVEDSFHDIWVRGEVSNFKQAASGHLYFTLKDQLASLSAVMFRPASQRLKFKIEEGMELISHGRLTVYEPRGQYQIILDRAEPSGIGALQLAYEQLKQRLAEEGLFDERHKRPLPQLPQLVGIITSPQGAVIHDMVTILRRRFPSLNILIHPVRVQGDGAAEEIAAAIASLNQRRDIDLLLVGRGGGSLEDLWAFNEEIVCRAIRASQIPIISAVGHETDFTLADLVADCRAPTPSAAAELAVPLKCDLEQQIGQNQQGLVDVMQELIRDEQERCRDLARRLKSPQNLLDEAHLRLDRCVEDLNRVILQGMREDELCLAGLKGRLKNLDPQGILHKGYSIVFQQNGLPLLSSGDVAPGDLVRVQLHEGCLEARILSVSAKD